MISYWFLLILALAALAIGLAFTFGGQWDAAIAMFSLAIIMVLLAIAITHKREVK